MRPSTRWLRMMARSAKPKLEVRLKALALVRHLLTGVLVMTLALNAVPAQAQPSSIIPVDLPVGRSYPLTTPVSITKVSIANPEVADVVIVGSRELVINAKLTGETDAIFWLANGTRLHYRVAVHSPSDRLQIALYIKIAEVRKDVLREAGVSGLFNDGKHRIGTGTLSTDNVFDNLGRIILPTDGGFLTVLSKLGTKNLLALIELEEQQGRAKTLAEPNLLAGNKDTATFLAGGELPIPILQPGSTENRVSIQYKEFGVRLRFVGEILNENLIKLTVRPEVSSLDFVNGIVISGFRIPAFRTRRVETTVDVPRDQSMIISGLFNNDEEKITRGIPFLMDLPIIGKLFSSTRWQKNESELLVVVTPVLVDPRDPRPQDILRLVPDTALPAREAIKGKLLPQNRPPSPIIR